MTKSVKTARKIKTKPKLKSVKSNKITEKQVIKFLTDNPAVLDQHPEVISQLSVTHETGGAVSLVERQIKNLRTENQLLKDKLSDLVQIARDNEELNQRFHRLSLELMASEQLHDILAMTRDQVQTFFYTDYVGFYFHDRLQDQLKGLENLSLDSGSKHASKIRGWMHERQPVFEAHNQDLNDLLFSNQNMLSSTLIPLYHTEDIGLLVLGSKSEDRFTADMGTVFLTQLGELISSKIKNFLK